MLRFDMKLITPTLRIGTFALSLLLAGCFDDASENKQVSLGSKNVMLEIGQPYCIHEGSPPQASTVCDDIFGIFIPEEKGELVSLQLVNGQISDTGLFGPIGSKMGSSISLRDQEYILQMNDGAIMGKGQSEDIWIVPAVGRKGEQLRMLHAAMSSFDPKYPFPDDQSRFLDVPLCYAETVYKNGQRVGYHNSCDKGVIKFYTSIGGGARHQVWQTQLNWLLDGDELYPGEHWGEAGLAIDGEGEMVLPFEYKDFEWSLGEDNSLNSAIGKRDRIYDGQTTITVYNGEHAGLVMEEYKKLYCRAYLSLQAEKYLSGLL